MHDSARRGVDRAKNGRPRPQGFISYAVRDARLRRYSRLFLAASRKVISRAGLKQRPVGLVPGRPIPPLGRGDDDGDAILEMLTRMKFLFHMMENAIYATSGAAIAGLLHTARCRVDGHTSTASEIIVRVSRFSGCTSPRCKIPLGDMRHASLTGYFGHDCRFY